MEYRRLEVGSPGIDRPLRHEVDYIRFEGQMIDLTLKEPIGVTDSGVAANRKKFRGTLERAEDGVTLAVGLERCARDQAGCAGEQEAPAAAHAGIEF